MATPTLDKVLSRSEDLGALAPFTVDDGVSLQWSGSIFPGKDPTVLYGDVEVYWSTSLFSGVGFALHQLTHTV